MADTHRRITLNTSWGHIVLDQSKLVGFADLEDGRRAVTINDKDAVLHVPIEHTEAETDELLAIIAESVALEADRANRARIREAYLREKGLDRSSDATAEEDPNE